MKRGPGAAFAILFRAAVLACATLALTPGEAAAQATPCQYPVSDDAPQVRCMTRAESTEYLQHLAGTLKDDKASSLASLGRVIALLTGTYGPTHPATAVPYCLRGYQNVLLGKFNEGVADVGRGLQIALSRYGQHHLQSAHCLRSAGNAYLALARASQTDRQRNEYLEGADGYYRAALPTYAKATPREQYELTEADVCRSLAAVLIMANRQGEVGEFMKRAEAIERRKLSR